MSLRNAYHDWHIVHSSVTASSFFFVQLYFEKGCRKKSTRQSQMLLWVFRVHCSSKTFERMAREAMDIRLRVLEESNKSRFDSYSARNSILCWSYAILPVGIVTCTFFRSFRKRRGKFIAMLLHYQCLKSAKSWVRLPPLHTISDCPRLKKAPVKMFRPLYYNWDSKCLG